MNGITRRIDELGRIVLPKDYRNALNVGTNCEMNLELKNGTIIITPATNHCCMCGKKISRVLQESLNRAVLKLLATRSQV